MTDNSKKFSRLVSSSSESRLASWILRSLRSLDFAPLQVTDQTSEIVQLANLYSTIEFRLQEKFNTSLVRAFGSWKEAADGIEVFERLSMVAAYLREQRSIGFIRSFINERASLLTDNDSFQPVMSNLISIVVGFVPDEEASQLVHRLFYDNAIGYKHIALLFVGLCKQNPGKYFEYIS